MAILNQLVRPEEFAKLGPEEQEIIKAFVNAGGAVAETFDEAQVRVADIDNPRFLRKFGPLLKEATASVPGFEEAKAKLFKRY